MPGPRWQWLSRLCLILLLTGCATNPSPPGTDWTLKGKLSIRSPEETRLLGINWQKRGPVQEIALSASLGISVADIFIKGEDVTVTTAEGVVRLRQVVRLPLESGGYLDIPLLPVLDWVDMAYQSSGKPPPLRIRGWQVEVKRMTGENPSLVQFESNGVRLRLSISSWQ